MGYRKKSLALLLITLLSFAAGDAQAAINELQPLNWGHAIVRQNNAQYGIVLQTNGSYIADPNFVIITPPQVGIYEVTGLPLNVPISVMVSSGAITRPASAAFYYENFLVDAPANSGPGTVTLILGGTFRTSGSMFQYGAGDYSGAVTITVNY